MSEEMFCSFIEKYQSSLYNLAQKVDELVYLDATSAVIQGRKFAENLLKVIYREEKKNSTQNFSPTLYEMIRELYNDGVLDKRLQEKFDFLRFQGNKAAHDDKEHSQIIALKVHKQVFQLAGWYTEVYGSPDFETPEYKEPKPATNVDEDYIQDLIKQHIQQFTNKSTSVIEKQTSTNETETFHIEQDLEKGESYLIRELSRLKASSQEALENVGNFSKFKDYLHVERNIQRNLEKELEASQDKRKKLILLSGSVGDGKSHLLSYLKEKKPQLIQDFTIINDATESDSPEKSSLDTLKEKLRPFSDQEYQMGNEQIILAINLGVINNFINYPHKDLTFNKFKAFIEESKLFTEEITEVYKDDSFAIINFSDYQPFQLSENKVFSDYFNEILQKITRKDTLNPFYQAYQLDIQNDTYTVVHLNYELLSNENTSKLLNKLLCYLILEEKMVISTRTFFNFIADILIPTETSIEEIKIQNMTEFERIDYSLPALLFDRKGRSEVVDRIQKYDPIHERSHSIDEIINTIYSSQDFNKAIERYIKEKSYKKILNPFVDLLMEKENSLEDESFQSISKLFIRAAFFTDPLLQEEIEKTSMRKYVRYLYGYNRMSNKIVKEIYTSVWEAILSWRGSPKRGYVYINSMSENYRLAQKIDFIPSPLGKKPNALEVLETFDTTINLAFTDQSKSEIIHFEIDYALFELLDKVIKGYRPNKKDYEDGLSFVTFMNQLISISKNSDLLIHYHGENELFSLGKDFLGAFAFEKVEK
ncbi:DNA phosphorothioation-dependent restriction protein DptF [Halobacillus faecis]|uniref:DUF4145 domain-containing protein n=1 Tax=Halobacillus faecis TaxID=360184 RepID=A0A511WQ78_9BACI|nr:DNA phosphorothioation-dependent restriction protein DptF [Halobacillus faecis]GEN52418.1 hypothetical protein HFA01_06800 [Halobacillus faecis]